MDRREFLQTTSLHAGCVVLQETAMALDQGDADQRTDSRPACSGGTLMGAIDLPYLHDPQTGVYALVLCSQFSVPGAFCFFCGGRPQGPWQTHPARCTCGWLATRAADPSSAIQWDREVLECYLLTSGGEREAHWPIYFCPSCGGFAPGSLV
jgi:hypothetical protein